MAKIIHSIDPKNKKFNVNILKLRKVKNGERFKKPILILKNEFDKSTIEQCKRMENRDKNTTKPYPEIVCSVSNGLFCDTDLAADSCSDRRHKTVLVCYLF